MGGYGGHVKRMGNQIEACDSGDISKFRKERKKKLKIQENEKKQCNKPGSCSKWNMQSNFYHLNKICKQH